MGKLSEQASDISRGCCTYVLPLFGITGVLQWVIKIMITNESCICDMKKLTEI
jgi:hypothetical protein